MYYVNNIYNKVELSFYKTPLLQLVKNIDKTSHYSVLRKRYHES